MNANGFSDVPHGQVEAAIFKLGRELGADGPQVIKQMNSDPGFVANIARLARIGGQESSTHYFSVRDIMGLNFIGLDLDPDVDFDAALRLFQVEIHLRELMHLSMAPFSEEILTTCKHSHISVVVPKLSILDIRDRFASLPLPTGQKKFFYEQNWYRNQAFAQEKSEPKWNLISKFEVDDSTSKIKWSLPEARALVYTILIHFLNTGERLFEKSSVRCSDVDSRGRSVYVGYFDSEGLSISCHPGDRRECGLEGVGQR